VISIDDRDCTLHINKLGGHLIKIHLKAEVQKLSLRLLLDFFDFEDLIFNLLKVY